MKIDVIDVSAHADNRDERFRGWGVSVSRKVWEKCVAVPKEYGDVSEEERIGDLLDALWAATRRQVTYEPEWHGGVPFTTEVHRTEAGRQPLARRLWRYRPAVQLHALPSLAPDGSPKMLVITPREVPCCCAIER